MEILGHRLVKFTPLKSISSKDELLSKCNEIVLFEYEPELIAHTKNLNQDFALHIFNESEAIIANATGAKILICSDLLAPKVQNLAEYYLFDAKIAILINNEDEIQKAIALKVDMAILPSAII